MSDTRVVVSAGAGNALRTPNREEPAFCSTCLADSSVGDKKLGLASELAYLVRPPTGEVVRVHQMPAPDDLQLTGVPVEGKLLGATLHQGWTFPRMEFHGLREYRLLGNHSLMGPRRNHFMCNILSGTNLLSLLLRV